MKYNIICFTPILQVFPIFYVLMSCKTTKAYQSVFQYIENNIFNLEPSQFLTDFEAGLRKALELCYPFAIILGCWFHYCSAIRRRVMSLRLYKLIAENRNARSIYKKIMSLPLLPPESILEGYEIILNEAETNRLSRTFKKVFEYYERFWLRQVRYRNYITNDCCFTEYANENCSQILLSSLVCLFSFMPTQ